MVRQIGCRYAKVLSECGRQAAEWQRALSQRLSGVHLNQLDKVVHPDEQSVTSLQNCDALKFGKYRHALASVQMYRTAVYTTLHTRVNGDIQHGLHIDNSKSHTRWYHSPPHHIDCVSGCCWTVSFYDFPCVHCVSKNVTLLFLWYLCQTSSDSANFWQKHAAGNLKQTHVHAQFISRFICSYCTL